MAELIVFGDIIEANGKTIRENNMARTHNIPLGTLVEVKWDEWLGDGACAKHHARLWVVRHDRDCDGSPLYGLSRWRDPEFASQVRAINGGFCERNLTPIEVTAALVRGECALMWADPQEDAT